MLIFSSRNAYMVNLVSDLSWLLMVEQRYLHNVNLGVYEVRLVGDIMV